MTRRNSSTEEFLADIPLVGDEVEAERQEEQAKKPSQGLSTIIPLRKRPRPEKPTTAQGIVRVDRALWYELLKHALRLPDSYRAWGAMDHPTGGFVDVHVESSDIPLAPEGRVTQVIPIYTRSSDAESGTVIDWSLDHIEFR